MEKRLSIADVVHQIIKWYGILKMYKGMLTICLSVGIISGLLAAYIPKRQYKQDMTFVIDQTSSKGGVGLGASLLLGSFGLNEASESKLEKIKSISRSYNIVNKALIRTMSGASGVSGYDVLYSMVNGLPENLQAFTDEIKINNHLDSSEYVSLIRGIDGNGGIIKTNYEEGSGIIRIEAISSNQEFSKEIILSLYEELSKFYIEQESAKPKMDYDILRKKADSLGIEIEITERKLSTLLLRTRANVGQDALLTRSKLERKKLVLSTIYIEVVKNLEAAEYILKSRTPYFKIIDKVQREVKPESIKLTSKLSVSITISLILGFIVAGIHYNAVILKQN